MANSEARKAALPARLRSERRASDASIAATKPSRLVLLVVALAAFGLGLRASAQGSAKYTTYTLALPSHGKGNITMDYIAYDPKTNDVYVGDGVVYIGDRTDKSICAVDERTLVRKNCGVNSARMEFKIVRMTAEINLSG